MKRWSGSDRIGVAIGMALMMGTLIPLVWGAWDSTKPAQTQTVSAGFTGTLDNFVAIEAGTATIPGTASTGFAVAEGGNVSGCTTNTLKDDGGCFEGDTSNAFETKVLITDPTADRTLTVPNADSVTLPTGAVFMMITGSCPAGTTDVSATYSNKFPRINATPASTGGADTHTHAAGSYAGPSHTHTTTIINAGNEEAAAGSGVLANDGSHEHTVNASGTGAVTGTSASGDNVPSYFTVILCQVS